MNTLPELNKFLRKWRDALREHATNRDFWEGGKAYRELNRTGWLDVVRIMMKDQEDGYQGGEQDPTPQHAIPQLCAILDAFRENLGQVRSLVDRQLAQEEWLLQHAKAFRKKARASDPELAKDLNRLARAIEEASRATLIRLRNKLNEQRAWVPLKGYGKIRQARQLDSWLILHLACIFRFYMPKPGIRVKGQNRREGGGPSLQTLSRLIVLFIVCADVAEVRDHIACWKHNGRKLTVSGVYQQLTRARMETDWA